MCAAQPLAINLIGQLQSLLQCSKVPLSQRAASGCELAKQMAGQASQLLQAKAAHLAIPLLDGAMTQIVELEVDGDDPCFDQLSASVSAVHVKVGSLRCSLCRPHLAHC